MRPRYSLPPVLVAILLAACGEADPGAAMQGGATRIVSLAPSLTELVYTVGAGDRLVGVSAWSDYPREARELPVVGDAFAVDLEQLRLADPDLVLVWSSGTPAHTVDELRAAGYRVETLRTRGLEDIAGALVQLGELTGLEQAANEAARAFRLGLESLRADYSALAPISVFYQVSARPLYTVNGTHYVSDLIAACGGRNVFADLSELAPSVDVEAVIARDPEVMLASTDAGDDAFAEWQRWPDLTASRLGTQFLLPADEIGRPTTRVLVAGRAMCIALEQARRLRAAGGAA